MAIIQTGSLGGIEGGGDLYTVASGTISPSITVPSDAEIMLIGVSAFSSVANRISANGSFDIGGVNSVGIGGASTAAWQCALHYIPISAPQTGTQDLNWQWGGGAGAALSGDASVRFAWGFWKGIDTGSPVRDSGGTNASGATQTTATLTALTGDLIIAFAASYNAAEANQTFSTSSANASILSQFAQAAHHDTAWITASPTGNQTISATTDVGTEGGIAAFVIKAAAGGFIPGQAAFTLAGLGNSLGFRINMPDEP